MLSWGFDDFADAALPFMTAKITIGAHAFIGARAFVLPGVTVGERAIVGACSVVTRDVAMGAKVAGNPSRVLTLARSGGNQSRFDGGIEPL